MQISYEFLTLKNGLKVLLIPSDTVNSAQVSGYVMTGSAIETRLNSGICHFIEHVVMTGNKKWPDHEKFEEEKELRGALDNAYTSKEEIKYYVNTPYSEVDFGMDLIYNTLFHSTLSEKNVERHRKIILDEISKEDDNVFWQNANFLWASICKNKSGYSQKISGTADHIKNFSRDDLYKFYAFTHQPKNMLLSVVGNFKSNEIDKWIKTFEDKPNLTKNLNENFDANPSLPIEDIVINKKFDKTYTKTDLIFTTLVFKIPCLQTLEKKEELALKFVFTVLCGPLTSRLMRRLRERENLLYSIEHRVSSYKTFANAKILWEAPHENYQKTFDIVLEELKKLFTNGITEVELDRYKKFVTNRSLIKYDDIYEIAELVENQILHNMQIIPDVKNLNSIIEGFSLNYINGTIKKYAYILEEMNVLRFGKI